MLYLELTNLVGRIDGFEQLLLDLSADLRAAMAKMESASDDSKSHMKTIQRIWVSTVTPGIV